MVDIATRPNELPAAILQANTQDVLYLFTADGQAVGVPVYQLPQTNELGSGVHYADLTALTRRQHLASALIRPPLAGGYLFLSTMAGVVKRVRLEDLPGVTAGAFTVMNVAEDDALGWARLTSGADEIVLATAGGQVIRFLEEEVRPMGLAAGGVLGIKLAGDEDGVVALDLSVPNGFVWSITDNGLAKVTALEEYPTQGRYGQGVINVRLPKDAGEVVAVVVGEAKSEVYAVTSDGQTRRTQIGKAAAGARSIRPRPLLRLSAKSRIAGAIVPRPRPASNGG
jgi:DNA gyrase subunit A